MDNANSARVLRVSMDMTAEGVAAWANALETFLAGRPQGVEVIRSITEPCIGYDDIVRYLHKHPTEIDTSGVSNVAQAIMRFLVTRCSPSLVVFCVICDKRYGTCRCPEQGAQHKGCAWSYKIFDKSALLSGTVLWRITEASFQELTDEFIRLNGQGAAHRTKRLVMAYVSTLRAAATGETP